MRKGLTLLTALCLALGLAGCGRAEDVMRQDGGQALGYYEAGLQAQAGGSYAEAAEAFSRAVEADDSRAAAYMGRADCYLAMARAGEADGPDLTGLALRDYELALGLDPTLGQRIHGIYANLAEQALSAGETGKALVCLRGALDTAGQEDAEQALDQVRELTGPILTASAWYLDAPDSRYYVFYPDGTGQIIDALAMEPVGTLAYENEGFTLRIAEDGGAAPYDWSFDPDWEGYRADIPAASADGGVLGLGVRPVSLQQLYLQWRDSILGAEAGLLQESGAEADPASGYGALYERAFALAEAMAASAGGGMTDSAAAALRSEEERRDAVGAYAMTAQDALLLARGTIGRLMGALPAGQPERSGSALEEIFPIGGTALLDYFRLLTAWTLDGRRLTVQDGADLTAQWESVGDVEHCFRDGRLYLCLSGYALREETAEVVPDAYGIFVIETPLTLDSDVTMTGERLLSRMQEEPWTALWDMEYSDETFCLELDLAADMTCSAAGGYYPGGQPGRQSGRYALEGNELTLTMTAEGYSEGTYRYEVIPMGDSLLMRALTDGIIYGQTAGSTCVLCGEDYGTGAGVLPGPAAEDS